MTVLEAAPESAQVRAQLRLRELILAGQVAASPAFRTWADLSGQGGYDEKVKREAAVKA